MDIEERAQQAAEFRAFMGYNCCQSVVSALADETKLSPEQLRQIAAGFGGGMGNMSGTCGALVGAGIVAGLKTEGARTMWYSRQINEKFKGKSGAVICKELKGIGTGKTLCSCEECVRNAVRAYGEVMGI